MAETKRVNAPGGIQYVLTLARTGTYKDKTKDMVQPKAVMGGMASGTGMLDITGRLANLILARGRWTVEARPVAGPGLDGLSIFRKTVRSRSAARDLVEEWTRQLEEGDVLTQ